MTPMHMQASMSSKTNDTHGELLLYYVNKHHDLFSIGTDDKYTHMQTKYSKPAKPKQAILYKF